MKRSKIRWYLMSVLAYYRSEWTDVPDEDKEYRLLVTKELEQLIRGCLRRGTSVPNAAKEVEIFLDLQEAKTNAEIESSLEYLKRIEMHKDPEDNPDA